MKAMVYDRYGGPDELELREVATPTPADHEVLVRVHAVSINDWDLGLLDGSSFVNRLINGLVRPRRTILGSDIAGHVEAVGRSVTRFRPGDEVFGDLSGRWGGFAEHVCAPESMLAVKPPSISFVEAAAIPQAGMLAVQGLIDRGEIRAGQSLLVNGAGGGVGTFAVQIAKLYGAEVTGVDSAAKLDLLRSLGCDKVIDYRQEDFTRSAVRYDLILDVKTSRSVLDCARALRRGGIYSTVGGSMPRLLQALLLLPLIRLTSGKSIRIVALQQNKDLAYLSELIEAGKVKPVLDRLHPLAELPEAMRRFAAAEHQGKIVITLE